MEGEIDGRYAVEEGDGRRGGDDLATVPERGDPGGAVDVYPDVALSAHDRRSGVQPYSDSDRTGGEGVQAGVRRRDRALGGGEGDEEGVPLRVYLHATPGRECLPEQPAMLSELGRIVLGAELLEEARRAHDVREEERDGAREEVGSQRTEGRTARTS